MMIARPPPANMKLNIEGQFLKTRTGVQKKKMTYTSMCVCINHRARLAHTNLALTG
jgi:hypothetical protein